MLFVVSTDFFFYSLGEIWLIPAKNYGACKFSTFLKKNIDQAFICLFFCAAYESHGKLEKNKNLVYLLSSYKCKCKYICIHDLAVRNKLFI